jgi:hypothetical protein
MSALHQLNALQALLEATEERRFTWRSRGQDWQGEGCGLTAKVRFLYPLLADDHGSDADVAEVTLARVVFRCYVGSPAFELVGRILAAADTDIQGHNASIAAKLTRAAAALKER